MKHGIDPWKDWDFSCPRCDWSGKGSALKPGDWISDGCNEHCPLCDQAVAWLEFPLIEESMANFTKLNPEAQKEAILIYHGHNKWQASKLKGVEQLPDIEGRYLVLVWDIDPETEEIVILHGQDVIFRMPPSYEYSDFFISACRILKTKYGYRLLDVVPTPGAEYGLYGDRLFSLTAVPEMRRLIGLDRWELRGDESAEVLEKRQAWKTYLK